MVRDKLAADLVAFDDDRIEACAAGVDGGRVTGAARTDDDNFVHVG